MTMVLDHTVAVGEDDDDEDEETEKCDIKMACS